MDIFGVVVGIIAKEPISSGLAKFFEVVAEEYAKLFVNRLFDGSKKHYENAAGLVSKCCIGGVDEKKINNTLQAAYKAFNKETNVPRKMLRFIETIRQMYVEELADKKDIQDNLIDIHTYELCGLIYDFIMQESDEHDGDKLKERFRTARTVYAAAIKEGIKDKISAAKRTVDPDMDEMLIHEKIYILFDKEDRLPSEFSLDMQDLIDGRENIIYDYEMLGNLIVVSARKGEGIPGDSVRAIGNEIRSLLINYEVDATSILIHSDRTDKCVIL